MVQGHERPFQLFIADQQFAKSVEPTVRHFDNPTPGLLGRVGFQAFGFFSAPSDVRNISVSNHGLFRGLAGITGIGAEVL